MRALSEEETKALFEKLAKFIGSDLMKLVENPSQPHHFRYHNDKVFYVSDEVMKSAINIPRDDLLSFGTQLGKFTKTKKFRLHVTALDYLAKYAKNKIWLKPTGEQSFLYGNNVIKRHVNRITENIQQNDGVIVYSVHDTPLGFGITSRSTNEVRGIDTEAVVVFRQADVGEYLRDEQLLF